MRVVFILAVLAVAVPASAQSLAELAAVELARRAAIKNPAKVITDKDLPADKPAGARRAPPGANEVKAAASATQRESTTQVDDNGHDERWWIARADPLRTKLATATRKLEIAKTRANAIAAEMKRSGTPARSAMPRRLEAAAAQVERCTAEVADARRALEDLEEEARKAGALPGWLRK